MEIILFMLTVGFGFIAKAIWMTRKDKKAKQAICDRYFDE